MDILKDLLNFNILDTVDIILVALLLYYVYKLIRGTVAINIFIGIVIFYLFFLLVDALEMHMLTRILGGFMSVGIIALIVVFQPSNSLLLIDLQKSPMLSSSSTRIRSIFSNFLMRD